MANMEVEGNEKEESVISKSFRVFSAELDLKHDKHERIFKLSREIVIESKRIIFSVHSLLRNDEKWSKSIEERFDRLLSVHFQQLSEELKDEDPYMYLRAYSGGLQEFIEAFTFYHFVKSDVLIGWNEMVSTLTFPNGRVVLPLAEYLLGIEDLTGELMRFCIMSLGKGRTAPAFQVCQAVKWIYTCLFSISPSHREYGKKLHVARESLIKMEYACYMIHVRGKEINLNSMDVILSSFGRPEID